ncbi:MAG: SDR family oxidoreductase [Acetobacteraceae bacterium]
MRLMIFGLGYVGRAVARMAGQGGTVALAEATHLLVTAPPGEQGDPLIAGVGIDALAAAPSLRWVGYLSTTGVYGDRDGGWVDEATPPAPTSDRSRRRLTAEAAWCRLADRRGVDIFRLAGIYGPGRSVFDDLRAGRARRIIKPGHAFGRIHRDDIARAVCAAMAQRREAGTRVFNLADDEPAESGAVIAEAARLLGVPAPPEVPFATVWASMSPMARSFWAENRKVSSRATQAALGIAWLYPTYREGLARILQCGAGRLV